MVEIGSSLAHDLQHSYVFWCFGSGLGSGQTHSFSCYNIIVLNKPLCFWDISKDGRSLKSIIRLMIQSAWRYVSHLLWTHVNTWQLIAISSKEPQRARPFIPDVGKCLSFINELSLSMNCVIHIQLSLIGVKIKSNGC